MSLNMLHYYFLKKIINNIPKNIIINFSYTNDMLFDLSTFNDLGLYYKILNPIKKDKYKINEKLQSEKFNDFILECISICKKNNNYNQLLAIYAMIAHNILTEHVNTFLSVRLSRRLKYDKACNIIDCYYSKINDNINLYKMDLTDFFLNGFRYYDFLDELIHNPLIKHFSFFCSKEYYTKAAKRKYFVFRHLKRSRTKIKLIFYKLYDIFLNHRGKPKASLYLYPKKLNTSLFNITKKPYLINDETFNYSLDEVINIALAEAIEYINALNNYLFNDNEKQLKKLFKLNKDEKL